MNRNLLNKEVQDFIDQNLGGDLAKIIFKDSPFEGVSIRELATQIHAKKQIREKLSTWFKTPNIFYPPKINLEQTSSEITAKYKSELVYGDRIIDLTGGFGVDAFFFKETFKEVYHCEIDPDLAQIAQHNFSVLNSGNVHFIQGNGLEFLEEKKQGFDWIYADPARRDPDQKKVFRLEDCLPDIPKNLDLLLKYSDQILLKLSPMMDLSSAVETLKIVSEIHILAIENEVKELLLILKKGHSGKVSTTTVNFAKNKPEIFKGDFPERASATYSLPQKYLYEPNAAILKAGLFQSVSHYFSIEKLQVNSHLYTSNRSIDFPGRIFHIESISQVNKKELKKNLPGKKANLTLRNFPGSVSGLKKKFGIRDGGEIYLFFTTDLQNRHIVLYCRKVNS